MQLPRSCSPDGNQPTIDDITNMATAEVSQGQLDEALGRHIQAHPRRLAARVSPALPARQVLLNDRRDFGPLCRPRDRSALPPVTITASRANYAVEQHRSGPHRRLGLVLTTQAQP
jgi:hypothetical protein